MVLREPAVIAQDFTAPVACDGLLQFAPAVPADPEVGLVVILVKPEAAVVLRQVVAETKIMAAPLARERDLLEYFSAEMAPAHHRVQSWAGNEIGCDWEHGDVQNPPWRNGLPIP